jgi:hypothetical protein
VSSATGSFDVSGSVTSQLTGDTYPVSMSVSLTASGTPETESQKFRLKLPGNFTESETFLGTFIGANITSGSASFNGAPMDFDFGQFGYTKSFSLEIFK